jgi:hypothetical protein
MGGITISQGELPMSRDDRLPRPGPQLPTQVMLGCIGCIGVCGLGAIIGAIVFVVIRWPSNGSPFPTGPKYQQADLTVSAESLFTAYCESVAVADRTYNGKILEVSGTVASRGRDQAGEYIIFAVVRPHAAGPVRLTDVYSRIAEASASGVQGVRCYVSAGVSSLENGQALTIRGRCVGMPLDVELRDCEATRYSESHSQRR